MAKPRVVVFTQDGCPSCENLKPIAQEYAKRYESCVMTVFYEVSFGIGQALAEDIGVESVPTVLVYSSAGEPAARMEGFAGQREKVERLYQEALSSAVSCEIEFKDV